MRATLLSVSPQCINRGQFFLAGHSSSPIYFPLSIISVVLFLPCISRGANCSLNLNTRTANGQTELQSPNLYLILDNCNYYFFVVVREIDLLWYGWYNLYKASEGWCPLAKIFLKFTCHHHCRRVGHPSTIMMIFWILQSTEFHRSRVGNAKISDPC